MRFNNGMKDYLVSLVEVEIGLLIEKKLFDVN